MKLFYFYGLLVITVIFGCHKNNQALTMQQVSGTYTSGAEVNYSNIAMYVSPLVNSLPITDTSLIGQYLRRNSINGFVFDGSGLPFTGKISVTIDNLNGARQGSVQSQGTGPNFNGSIEGDGPSRDVNSKDSVITLIAPDSIPYATIPTDSCYRINSGATTTYYQASTTGLNKATIYRKRYPIQFSNNQLAIHLITAVLNRNSGTSCSNVINGEWGYDIFKYVFAIAPSPLKTGDTLVIQTRLVPLSKAN